MFKSLATATFVLTMCGSALADCPAIAPGDTAAEIQANGQRLICLQNELAQAGQQRQTQLELDQLQRAWQSEQLQRRFDALPKVEIQLPTFEYVPPT